MKFEYPDRFEILPVIGSIQGLSRKLIVLGCYMPPNYTSSRAAAYISCIEELVIEAKRHVKDPLIIITGDFNQWRIQDAFDEFRDIHESTAGPTRGTRTIDRTFSNTEKIYKIGTLNPLQTDDETSELHHRAFFLSARIRRQDKYKWLKYSYRYNNPESCRKFGEWLAVKDWAELVQAPHQ